MQSIKFADFLAIAKTLGYTGATSPGDVEAIRAFIVGTKKIVNNTEGKAIDWATVVVENEPLVVKTATVTETPAVNPTSDIETIVKARVDAELAKARPSNNPNAAIADPYANLTVIDTEEALYNTSRKHFRDFKTAKRFRDLLTVKMGQAKPEFLDNPRYIEARKRISEDPVTKAYGTTTQGGGGALAFQQFIPDVIQNFVQYGVSRRLAQVWPMTQETAFIPKQVGIQTVTYPQQGSTISQTTGVTFSNVQLTAKTGTAIIKASMQLMQDANILIANNFMEQLSRAFAYVEDQMLINANGEANYGGCVGLVQRFLGVSSTLVAPGNVIGGSSWDGHTMTHFSTLLGVLPDYARPNAAFLCHPAFLGTMARLGQAQGGVTFKETTEYGYVAQFMGIPVITSNVFASTNAGSNLQIDCMLGDFKRAAAIGDRMGLQLDVSDQRYWDDYSIGIRGVIRHDVQVHDVGTTSAAGPVVSLSQS